MARPNIETAAAPAVQNSVEANIQLLAALVMIGSVVLGSIYPGAFAGAAAAGIWRWLHRPTLAARIGLAIALGIAFLLLFPLVQTGWLWRDTLSDSLPTYFSSLDPSLVWRSLPVEALLGPAAVELFFAGFLVSRRTVGRQVLRDHRADQSQWQAVSGERSTRAKLTAMVPDPHIPPEDAIVAHPGGFVRIGVDGETNRPIDLQLPAELSTHVFLPGASGSGKTTTLLRLADGAIANWYGVIIIDCKGGDLSDHAYRLASQYELPFHIVDPDDDETLGYNVCAGDGAAVANKLIGAFSYGANADIYKNIAMQAVPIAISGLIASGQPVTLETLYDAFGARGFVRLAQNIPESPKTSFLRKRLKDLAPTQQDRVTSSGLIGLQHRLGALLEGKFGPLFRMDNMLDWNQALAEPSVTYIGLSTLASSEDVELMGRVIAQDLKQVCARRLKALRQDGQLMPVLAIFDEFAALKEAEQLVDLLVQARQALMPTIISTQYIPESLPLQRAALSAGLILSHRVEANDAQEIANQFGTHKVTETTHQLDYETGFSEKGSIKRVDAYNVHPNILRTLAVGKVAMKSTSRGRHAIVNVFKSQ